MPTVARRDVGGSKVRPAEMEPGERRAAKRTTRIRRLLAVLAVVLLVIVIVVVAVAASRTHKNDFKTTFTKRCEEFTHKDHQINCQTVLTAFEKAYVGQDPCQVPMQAYDPLIAAAPFTPACNRMMFWSKTKDVVHDFTEKKDCFLTLEDTLLGSVLDGLTWCGEKDSQETFTTGCPGWTDCDNNPVRSFWNRVSAGFAAEACGDVTVMLNGSITTPFSPASIFGSIEVKRFNSTRMKSLNVALVTDGESPVANCTNPSLKDLQNELDKGLKYNCQEVSTSQLDQCTSNPETPCGSCW